MSTSPLSKQNLLGVTLIQRNILYKFRKSTGINRSGVEVMAFASIHLVFNIYEILKYYREMNVQQLRSTVNRLITLQVLEKVGGGVKGKPNAYMLSFLGKKLIEDYLELWIKSCS